MTGILMIDTVTDTMIYNSLSMNNNLIFDYATNYYYNHTFDDINEIDVDPEVMNIFVHPPMKSFNFGFALKL